MYLYILAFILGLVGIIALGVLFRKFTNKKIQRLIVDLAVIIIFVSILIGNALKAPSWTPLNDFFHFFGNVTGTALIPNIIFFLLYILSGFALGSGFVQFLKLGEYKVRISSTNLSMKKLATSILYVIQLFFMIVVIVMMVYVLLDLFGIIYAAGSLRQIFDNIIMLPIIWYYTGTFIFCFKYWRNGRFNLDFITIKPKRNLDPEKIQFHKIVSVFLIGFSFWIFVLFEYYSVFPYPGKFLFSIFLFLGFNINYVKEIPIKEV